MQQPRRTTEFHHDEPGPSRQSRAQQRVVPSPATAQKFPRQSRIAVRTGSTSLDRAGQLSVPCSAPRGVRKMTPQRTPLQQSTARVLFTVEKQRAGGGGDKTVMQEQMQRITEHLRNAAQAGTITGFGAEYFMRAGALKQMSIKHFVAIINYFLHHIWGNRFTVSNNNHVDDIVNIMQKRLNYPHQLNKSWLKTPNTQHSFGNVILLLDFLMDFVPSNDLSAFPLSEPIENTISNVETELQQIPDIEFQAELLRQSEEGFLLWDKKMDDEFMALQQQTCDLLIQKRCGVSGSAALNAELNQLQQTLDEVQQQRPNISKEEQKLCRELEKQQKDLLNDRQRLEDLINAIARELTPLLKNNTTLTEEVADLSNEIEKTQSTIKKQIITVEKRNSLIAETDQLRYMLRLKEHTVGDLIEQDYNQQVLLSVTKKKLADQVAAFNKHMYEIALSQKCYYKDLQLDLNAKLIDLQHPLELLNTLHQKAQLKLTHDAKKQEELEQELSKKSKLNAKLQIKNIEIQAALTATQKQLQKLEQEVEEKLIQHKNKQLQLKDEAQQQQLQMNNLQQLIVRNNAETKNINMENNRTLFEAQENYKIVHDKRSAELDKHENLLEQGKQKLVKLEEVVRQNELMLKKLNLK